MNLNENDFCARDIMGEISREMKKASEVETPSEVFESEKAEILKKFQNGEATEEETLRALGKKFLKCGASSDQSEQKPELDIKIRHFSVYTRRQGKMNVYFAFTPVNPNEWKEKIPKSPALENNEYHSGK